MKPQIKLEARQRVAQILAAALELAPKVGYQKLTRDAVAKRLGVAPSLVPAHMGTMAEFRRQIMREAVRVGSLPVIAQGLVARDRHALKASPELRARALQYLAS